MLREEKKVLAKWYAIEKEETKRRLQRRMELEKRHIQRVKKELLMNSEIEMNRMKQLEEKQKVGIVIQTMVE